MERHTHKFQQTKNSFGALEAEASVGSVSKALDAISTPGAGFRVQGSGFRI